MRSKKIRLTVEMTRFVTPDSDPDEPPASRSLLICAVTYQKALGLAGTRKWFKQPRKHFQAAETKDFCRALKEALNEKVEVPVGPRGSSRFSSIGQLRDFFAQPAQARALARLMAFLEGGGSMTVTDE